MLVEDVQDVLADLGELALNLLPVALDHLDLSLIALRLLLLLNRRDDAPRRMAGTDDVLVGNGEQVALLNGELLVGRSNTLHVLDHLWKTRIRHKPCAMETIGTANHAPS